MSLLASTRPHQRLASRRRLRQQGAALLAVLWLSAALSAIALTIAATVRAEIERSTIQSEGVRAYFLARAGIERAAVWVQWGRTDAGQGANARYYRLGIRSLAFSMPTGDVVVDVIPEAAKLDINRVKVEELILLLQGLGLNPLEAQELAMAIHHWRSAPDPSTAGLDAFYTRMSPSFPARHSSLENVEELLLVKGMTPELFYGTYVPVPGAMPGLEPGQGSGTSDFSTTPVPLVWRGGLRDCVSVFGSISKIDVNWAEPASLLAVGLPLQAVQSIVARRELQPFFTEEELQSIGPLSMPGRDRLRIGGRTQFTLRATAQLRQQDGKLSNVRRSVAATLDLNEVAGDRPFTTLRWYDTAWKQ